MKDDKPTARGTTITEWQPIETAPKDGTHITVINVHNSQVPPTTVHWFSGDEGGNWHLSVNQMSAYSDYVWGPPTHWMRIPAWNHLLGGSIAPP